ncbi:MAG: FtsX-like permease family protein [Thermodesulfobacteriota bacterium]|nr:FtsX-like permease family protein [Thermodesulfobacteriota bacterium]
MIARMAWRNLWRNRRRTIITLVSIAFGFLLALTFTSLSDGSYGQMIDTAARMGTGHVTIEPQGYRDKPGHDLVVRDTGQLADEVRAMPGIENATIRIVGQAMAATSADSTGAGIIALDPESEQGVFFLLNHVVEGQQLASREEKKVLIGKGMARRLDLNLGKKLVLTTTDKTGEIVSGLVRVAGIFSTGVDEADKYIIIVPIDYMRVLLGYSKNEATQIAVYLNDRRDAEEKSHALALLAAAYNGTALPWSVMMPDVAGVILMDSTGNYFLQVFIFLLVGAGILNTVLMGVMERLREFGIMLAVGMSPGKLWRMIMTETFWLAVVGLLVSSVLSVPVYWYLHKYGIDISVWLGEDQVYGGVLFDPLMKAEFYLDHAILIFSGVFILILAAGLYPAFLAARTRPVETIKIL